MPKTAVINIRTEADTKKKIEQLYSQFGISVSDAVNIFFHQSLMQGGLPFAMQIPKPNAETLAAMQEIEQMLKEGTGRRFNSVDELFEELDS